MKVFLIFFFVLGSFKVEAAGVRPNISKPALVSTVFLDDHPIADLWAFPRDKRSEFLIEAAPLLDSLKPLLKEQYYRVLSTHVMPEGVVSLSVLESAGLVVTWDEATLVLKILIPLKYRQTTKLSLNFVEVGEQKYYRPDEHNGYLNLRLSQPYLYGENAPSNSHQPLTARTDLVENIDGFVLETAAEYQEFDEAPWKRQDTRIRKDDEENMLRYTFGDLTLRTQGFQLAPSLGGVSVTKEFSIQPYKTLRQVSRSEIELKRVSLVEIYVNGLLTSQKRLGPGRFDIRDFPISSGLNDVKIKVRDDLGQEEVYDFTLLFENSILAQGVHEFSYAAGSPWTPFMNDRTYDTSGFFTTLFHRFGYTDTLTLGLNYQNFLTQSLTGAEVSHISKAGVLSSDTGYSAVNSEEGWAERLTYRSLDRMFGHDMPVVLASELQWRDRAFAPPMASGVFANLFVRRYDVQLNSRSIHGIFGGLGGAYEAAPSGIADSRYYRASLTLPLSPSSRLELSYNKKVSDVIEDRGYISFFWTEPQSRYSLSAYHDSLAKSNTISVNRNNRYNYDDMRMTASVQKDDTSTTGSVYGEYLTQPAGFRLDQYTVDTAGKSLSRTTLGLNTGVAWVGSHWAFTQPVSDSFILVAAENLPKDQEMMINPTGTKGEAQLGPRSVTVLRDRSSYYRYLVNLDSTSLPMGYLLDKEYYGALPTYHSGILISVKFERKVMVKGQLQAPEGQVLSLVAGDIVNQQGQLVDNTFFTNREGRFLIEGLTPGRYKILTDRQDIAPVEFTVQDVPENSVDLGVITVSREKQ